MNTILVIDAEDNPAGLAAALQKSGFTVFKEQQSGDGLRTAVEVVPQLVIVDENMPPLDGTELLRLLRSFTDSLIIVKGEGGTAATNAMLQGADLYLVRSVTVKEVLVRVRALLRRWTMVREESSAKRRPVASNGFDRELSLLT